MASEHLKEQVRENYKPCSTPSAQVRSPQEFQRALPHLHNTVTLKLNSESLAFMYSLNHIFDTSILTNEDVHTRDNDGHRNTSQQDVILLRKYREDKTNS